MIKNLVGRMTQDVYDGENSRYARKLPQEIHGKARRLLDQINSAPTLKFLKVPPSNRLEKLRGDLKSYWSLRINDQWRIIFQWDRSDALNVEIKDYH